MPIVSNTFTNGLMKQFDILYKMIAGEANKLKRKGYNPEAADEIMIWKFKEKQMPFKGFYDLQDILMGLNKAEYVKENYNTEEDEKESENNEFEIFCYLLYRFREFGNESVKYEIN